MEQSLPYLTKESMECKIKQPFIQCLLNASPGKVSGENKIFITYSLIKRSLQ
jgi:hypothetical protein